MSLSLLVRNVESYAECLLMRLFIMLYQIESDVYVIRYLKSEVENLPRGGTVCVASSFFHRAIV